MCITYLLKWDTFKTFVNVIIHILLLWHQQTCSKMSTSCCVLLHSYIFPDYPGITSTTLKIQLPLTSDHMLLFSVVQMSDKCDFCSISLFVPFVFLLCSFLYSFSAAINLYTIKRTEKHINWKIDYITLKACLQCLGTAFSLIDLSALT